MDLFNLGRMCIHDQQPNSIETTISAKRWRDTSYGRQYDKPAADMRCRKFSDFFTHCTWVSIRIERVLKRNQ